MPRNCIFDIEKITQQGGEIPSAVEKKILSDLFDHDVFKRVVLEKAKNSVSVGSLMVDLTEPPPPGMGEAIPFLGETRVYEMILAIAAGGDIVLNVDGTWVGRRAEDASDEDALRHIQKAFRSGQEMRRVQMGLPGAVGGGTVAAPADHPAAPQDGAKPATPPVSPGGNVNPFPPAAPPDGSIAGGAGEEETEWTDPVAVPPVIKNKKSPEPVTGINLTGCFENWGISSGQTIENARIEFAGLTAQQIKRILQGIPSTFKATLDITYREGDPE